MLVGEDSWTDGASLPVVEADMEPIQNRNEDLEFLRVTKELTAGPERASVKKQLRKTFIRARVWVDNEGEKENKAKNPRKHGRRFGERRGGTLD